MITTPARSQAARKSVRRRVLKSRPPTPPGPDDFTYSWFLGIDPGSSGGLCAMTADGRLSVRAMPTGDGWEEELWAWAASFMDLGAFACIEQVGGYIRRMPSPDDSKEERGGPQPGSSAFKFGRSYGTVRMALVAAGIPFYDPVPRRWQASLGVPPKSKTETKAAFKSRLRDLAASLFPKHRAKIPVKLADSVLLSEYARRLKGGLL